MCAARQQSDPGDVKSVDYADPPTDETRYTPHVGRVPEDDERVAIRLVGHPFAYIVRVATAKGREPRLTELTMRADQPAAKDGDVNHATLRAVPVRRLAYTAAQWIDRHGGLIGDVDDTAEVYTQPENHDPRVYKAAQIAERALSLGLPVRPTVAKELPASLRTVDRLLKRAKAEVWLSDDPLPKRPQPQQRDTKTSKETRR